MTQRLPDDRMPLLVPEQSRKYLTELGMVWHDKLRVWHISRDKLPLIARQNLPLRERPELQPSYIRINLIPQTSWGRNIRGLIPKDEWKSFVRQHIYPMTGHVCYVCGYSGNEWPVEADEVWRFDDQKLIQKLHKIVPLCPKCHQVRSAGKAISEGKKQIVIRHLAWVNRSTPRAAERIIDKALEKWSKRSRNKWTINTDFMEQKYGMMIKHDDRKTNEINARLVAEGLSRRGTHG